MAAPTHKTLHNIAGRSTLNKSLSDPFNPVLNIQAVNGFIRSIAAHTGIHLTIAQPSPDEIHLQQTATGASVPAVTEDWILDWIWRDGHDPLFGEMKGRARWISIDEAQVEGGDWDRECDGGLLMQAEGNERDDEWGGTRFWGFETVEGERRYFRRIFMVNNRSGEKMGVGMVYDSDWE
ncbi:MAG: hypothetical protein L6R38_009302 [Xanthoria sp. 2 TBL-2021]|nr:MAG: hypothetical protein L6R38_009302 [Xanthoria sp. 2 TBL-2021]